MLTSERKNQGVLRKFLMNYKSCYSMLENLCKTPLFLLSEVNIPLLFLSYLNCFFDNYLPYFDSYRIIFLLLLALLLLLL